MIVFDRMRTSGTAQARYYGDSTLFAVALIIIKNRKEERGKNYGSAGFSQSFETNFYSFAELSAVPVEENGERIILINASSGVKTYCIDSSMKYYTGEGIYVRETVRTFLEKPQEEISKIWEGGSLEVVYVLSIAPEGTAGIWEMNGIVFTCHGRKSARQKNVTSQSLTALSTIGGAAAKKVILGVATTGAPLELIESNGTKEFLSATPAWVLQEVTIFQSSSDNFVGLYDDWKIMANNQLI
jgi:hypothetical protein